MMSPLLVGALVVVPLLGAILVAALPGGAGRRRKALLAVASLELLLAFSALVSFVELPPLPFQVPAWAALDPADAPAAPGFALDRAWLPALGLQLRAGIDDLSVYPLIATALVFLVAVSAGAAHGRGRSIGLLVALASVNGIFLATDLLLFAVFAQTAVFGLFFSISLAAGTDEAALGARQSESRRVALRFLTSNYAGTLAVLAAALAVRSAAHQQTGSFGFSPEQLHALALPSATQTWIGVAFGLFVAIQLPVPPFHRWFVELCANPSRSLTEALFVVGVWPLIALYGLLRFALPLCPEPVEQAAADWGGWAAALTALYGAALAFGERLSARRRLACICVSYNGLILLGLSSLNSEGVHGSFLYALNHGIARTLLVALAATLAVVAAPRTGGRALLWWGVVLAFVGLPVASPFSGALLCVIGGFAAFPGLAAATLAGILGAAYSLLSTGRQGDAAQLGPAGDPSRMVACVLALSLAVGLRPGPLLEVTTPAVERVITWLPTGGYRVIGTVDPGAAAPAMADTTRDGDDPGAVEGGDGDG